MQCCIQGFLDPMFPGRTRWQDGLLLCLLYVSLAPLMPTSGHARSHEILCHFVPTLTLSAYIPSRCTPMLPAVGDVASSYYLQVGLCLPHYETILCCHGLVSHSTGSPTVRGLQGRTLFFPTIVQSRGHKAGDDEVVTCP